MDKISKKDKMIIKKIKKLKKLITNYNLDGYIIPKNDAYFAEYSFPNRLNNIKFQWFGRFCYNSKDSFLNLLAAFIFNRIIFLSCDLFPTFALIFKQSHFDGKKRFIDDLWLA